MMMKRMILMAFSAVLLAAPISAQLEPSRRATRTILTDDDDGKVEVWRRGDAVAEKVGDSSIRQPLLQVIFAGSGWQQSVKDRAMDGLMRVTMPDGVRPAAIVGSRDLPASVALNDLGIQSILDRAMRDGSLSMRDANVIHIVLLAPNVRSTLGAFKPGTDYDSYHSHVHMHDTNVRYVVVPWNDDDAGLREAAAKSMLRAVLNPDGD